MGSRMTLRMRGRRGDCCLSKTFDHHQSYSVLPSPVLKEGPGGDPLRPLRLLRFLTAEWGSKPLALWAVMVQAWSLADTVGL